MPGIVHKFLYRVLMFLDAQKEQAKIYYQSKKLRLGSSSSLAKGAIIHNMPNNPDLINIGSNSQICGELLVFNYGGSISIGNNCFVGPGTRIWSGEKISIGNHVLISHNVNIVDTTAHEINHIERAEGYKKIQSIGYPKTKGSIQTSAVVIEDHVWVSFNASILKGVHIGKGAIVAANAVVTKDVPEFTMVAGNPAVEVKNLKP